MLSANNDTQKIKIIMEYIGADTSTDVVDFFRLGREGGDKPRPLKVHVEYGAVT